MERPSALIITGHGLNCEVETKYCLEKAGAQVTLMHLNDLIGNKAALSDFNILAFIGGFAHGDHIAAGRILANTLKAEVGAEVDGFISKGGLIIGICNGFQTMIKMGLLPGFGDYSTQRFSITNNRSGIFEDRWVRLKGNGKSPCVFTRGVKELYLPVRHGEGQLCIPADVLEKMKENNQIALQYADASGNPTMDYPLNPNGAVEAIAGVCDPTGRIFGMMPHPEAYNNPYNHPHWVRQKAKGTLPKEGLGMQVFRNAVEYLKNK